MLNSREEILPYVPHSGAMLLLDRVLEYSTDHIVAELEITSSLPFYTNGSLPAYLCIEVMAQSVAAWFGLFRGDPSTRPPLGFLVGVRQFKCALRSFSEASVLSIYAKQIRGNDRYVKFNCQASYSRTDEVQLNVAEALISAYISDEI